MKSPKKNEKHIVSQGIDDHERLGSASYKESQQKPTTCEGHLASNSEEIHEKSRNSLWEAFICSENKEKSREQSTSPQDQKDKNNSNTDIM